MNHDKTLKKYFEELSSNSPVPGGGNVAAMTGALSSSLCAMVCNLTIGKKKYAKVEEEMSSLLDKAEEFRNKFLDLSQKDNEAFEKVMEAFKLPKETDAEKNIRSDKIEEATIYAAEIPLETIRTISQLISVVKTISQKGNKNSISDIGCAASLLRASAESAYLNVLINCASLQNQITAGELLKQAEVLLDEIKTNSLTIIEKIIGELKRK